MGERPFKGATIGRIDGSKGYSPTNCRWETALQQGRNTSRNVNVEIDGVTKCVSEWVQSHGLTRTCIYNRMVKGLSAKEAVIEVMQLSKKATT